jgi:uncharacterized membrane protein YkoI
LTRAAFRLVSGQNHKVSSSDRDENQAKRRNEMRKRIAVVVAAVVAAALLAGGAVAIASGDSEGGVTGPDADQAVKAALEATGGGTANSVELDDENGAVWEVEVTKEDGHTVDVRLSDTFAVVVIEGDSESPDDDDES